MRNKKLIKFKQSGFSLIELMVALVLGLVILLGVLNLFSGSNRTWRVQDSLFRVQESGRFALDILQKDLRKAGFQDMMPASAKYNPDFVAVRGYAAASPPASASVVSGVTSDILEVDLGDVTGANKVYFYLANDVTTGESTLYRNNDATVEGLEDIQFLYGQDTDNDHQPDSFVTRSAVGTDWKDIVAVRISLLVAGGDPNVLENQQVPAAPFNTFDTSDKRAYQTFSFTVALRNKML